MICLGVILYLSWKARGDSEVWEVYIELNRWIYPEQPQKFGRLCVLIWIVKPVGAAGWLTAVSRGCGCEEDPIIKMVPIYLQL